MISPYIQVKLDEDGPQFKKKKKYADNNGLKTTPSAILNILNSLPEVIEQKSLRANAHPSLEVSEDSRGNNVGQAENGGIANV